jgi:cysteinyl-tRNA synthetase
MDRYANNVLDTDYANCARSILNLKMKFLEMMDDDFNTAGAIAVLHEMAGEVNGAIEKHNAEHNKQPEVIACATAGAASLRKLGLILGLFRPGFAKPAARETGLSEQLMKLIIQLRATARKEKNFGMADAIRKGLEQLGITLEDRADGTIWRKE